MLQNIFFRHIKEKLQYIHIIIYNNIKIIFINTSKR